MFDAVAFAGGGNRCYWQGGFWEAAAPLLGLTPDLVVGVSAGAWSACYSLLGIGRRVNELVAEGCSAGRRNFEWRAWRAEGSPWPVALMYRSLIEAILDEAAFARLKRGPGYPRRARPQAARVCRSRSPSRSALAAYQLEKKISSPVHPRGGRALGFQPDFIRLNELASRGRGGRGPHGLRQRAALHAGRPRGRPRGPGRRARRQRARGAARRASRRGADATLVILSRLYKAFPRVPGRLYVQPSERVPVGQFDITNPAGIRKAYEMGLRDGEDFARRLSTSAGRSAIEPIT